MLNKFIRIEIKDYNYKYQGRIYLFSAIPTILGNYTFTIKTQFEKLIYEDDVSIEHFIQSNNLEELNYTKMEQLVKLIKKKLDSLKIKIKEVNLNIRFCEFTFYEKCRHKTEVEFKIQLSEVDYSDCPTIKSFYESKKPTEPQSEEQKLKSEKEHQYQSAESSQDKKSISSKKEDEINKINLKIAFKSSLTSDQEIRSLICFELKGVCLTISGESNGIINVWNFNDNQHLYKLNGHTQNVNALIRVNIDENEYLASASKDTKVIIWDVENGKALFKLSNHIGSVYSLAVVNLRGIKCLASGSKDGSIIIWDLKTKTALCNLKEHTSYIFALTSYKNKTLISGGEDKTVKIWNLKSQKAAFTLEKHTSCILTLAISTFYKRLISGSADKTIIIWNLKTSEILFILQEQLGTVYSLMTLIIKTKEYIVSGDGDNTVIVWDLLAGTYVSTIHETGMVLSLASMQKSNQIHRQNFLLSGGSDNSISIHEFLDNDLVES